MGIRVTGEFDIIHYRATLPGESASGQDRGLEICSFNKAIFSDHILKNSGRLHGGRPAEARSLSAGRVEATQPRG